MYTSDLYAEELMCLLLKIHITTILGLVPKPDSFVDGK